MLPSLSSLIKAFVGKAPNQTSRLDTATRMAMDADFSDHRKTNPERNLERLSGMTHTCSSQLHRQKMPHCLSSSSVSSMKRKNTMPMTSADYTARCLGLGIHFLDHPVSTPDHDFRRGLSWLSQRPHKPRLVT
jgi:hypothetical protein